MRLPRIALVLLALAGCAKITPPPVCCPGVDDAPPRQQSLRARADAFQRVIDEQLRPHWPSGTLVNLQFPDSSMSGVPAYNDQPDSAIYTGIYAAAQAFRYASARNDAEKTAALKNVRDAANALHALAEAPGYDGGLARAIAEDEKTICPGNQDCYQNERTKIWWLGNTSRDQYTGWWFGNAIVYRLVDDAEIRSTIREDVREMITAIRGWKYTLHDRNGQPNTGTAGAVHHQMRITWHLIAASILDEPLYREWYREQTKALELDEAWLEDAFDVTNVYYDYYGFNLGFLNAYNMVLLERDPKLRARYLGWMKNELHRHVKGTSNAFFDYMYMAASNTRPGETLAEDRTSLEQFPGPPSVWSCVSPPGRQFSTVSKWMYLTNRFVDTHLHQGKMIAYPQSATPYPLSQRCRTDFQWSESPYRATCCCNCATTGPNCPANTNAPEFCSSPTPTTGYLVYPGADYLVAYWMGRHHGFLTEGD